ncbi:MAG TPA: LPS export ABC transporter periplasmic protein LptC [Marinospirillum sp.]|uniref:LPS export ABC transporter periplasmic protein LptC n=1 Tax=Marinospirillum sp. TaxID=2183934 RepID=UPI002B474351|nr:LPS export ABC transporter periplasmic protein LptC [Marinospirillum sp.]HKM15484.1 LPS export ABC transporter periplasmic protein LptC [Marinospirillum sp.]
MLRKLGTLAVLISLGALLVLLQEINLSAPHTQLPEQYGEPDYYVENASLSRFGAQGQRLQTLDAVQVTHYPEKDLALFETPLLHHYTQQGQIWRVVAKRAKYLGEDEIYLEDKVVITPINPNSVYLPEFLTQRLWINSANNTAQTPDPVSFISPNGKTTGQGLDIQLNTGLAHILQTVQGNYLPPKVKAIQDNQP